MDLIDRDELRKIIYNTGRCNGKTEFAKAISDSINDVPAVDAVPVDVITGLIDALMFLKVMGNEVERIASHYGIIALEALLDGHYEANKHEQ